MKKFGILALLVSLVAGAVFAADATPVAKDAAGVVVSYTPAVTAVAADVAKKIDAVAAAPAVLVAKVGTANVTYVIDAKTTVAGKDAKAVAITALKAGDKVGVKYTEANKVLTAISVTLE